MVIPDRKTLVQVLANLLGKRINESNPDEYALNILRAVQGMQPNMAREAICYLIEAPVDTVINYHGQGAPEAEKITIVKMSLEKLRKALGERRVLLDEGQIRILKSLVEEMDNYAFESNPAVAKLPSPATILTPPTISGMSRNTPVPINSPEMVFTPPTISDLKKGLNTPLPLGGSRRERAAEAGGQVGPVEVYNTEQLFKDKEKTAAQEFVYYALASVALGGVVYLILDAYYQDWELITRVALSAAVPVSFMTIYALLRTFEVLQYVRMIFGIMFGGLILYLGAIYGYKVYEAYQAKIRFGQAQDRIFAIGRAIDAFQRENGRFPASLNQLVTPRNFLRPSEEDGRLLFTDPFNPPQQFLYQRSVDTWMIRSVGPQQREILFDIPNRFDREFWERHSAISYDPTNGARSAGNIIVFSQRIMQERARTLAATQTQAP